MLRVPLSAAALFMVSAAVAGPAERSTPRMHGVPVAFVHRTVLRESRYNPGLVHHHCFGLMQIKYATARGMGYKGDAPGLLDPQVNLTYGVPYLANAYHLAEGNEDRATALYRGGYYYLAKRQNMLGKLRTASAPPVTPGPALPQVPEPPRNPFVGLLSFLAQPAEAAAPSDSSQIRE